MITPEFQAALSGSNLRPARIMLKNSLHMDPTFFQFDEMLAHARRERPDILVPYDGEPLENDRSQWDQDLMNRELGLLLMNFSQERIDHLKQVISVLKAGEVRSIRSQRAAENSQRPQGEPPKAAQKKPSDFGAATISILSRRRSKDNEPSPPKTEREVLVALMEESKRIQEAIQELGRVWDKETLRKIENSAKNMKEIVKNCDK